MNTHVWQITFLYVKTKDYGPIVLVGDSEPKISQALGVGYKIYGVLAFDVWRIGIIFLIYISSFNIGYGPLDFDLVHVEDILNLSKFSSSSLSRENRFKGPIGKTLRNFYFVEKFIPPFLV